jgi:hypothetical protein
MTTVRVYNLLKMTTATTGTGTLTLGAAVAGFRQFSTAVPDGGLVRYAIADPGLAPTQREWGTGTYTSSGTTLTRTLGGSSTGALLNLSGAAHVSVTLASQDICHFNNYITGATGDTTIVIPANFAIAGIYITNTTANSVTGGIKIGTTSGATDVVVSQAVGANDFVSVSDATLLKRIFSMSSSQTLYIQAVSSWNSASLNIIFDLFSL